MKKVYEYTDYDKHLALKLGADLGLVVAYFLRPFVLKISTIQIGFGKKSDKVAGLKELVYPDDFGFFIAFLAAIPALIVLITYMKRKPGASDMVKKLWRNGRNLLVVAAGLNIAIIFLPFAYLAGYSINLFGWAQLALAIFIMYFLYNSDRVRDTFADFPSEAEEE